MYFSDWLSDGDWALQFRSLVSDRASFMQSWIFCTWAMLQSLTFLPARQQINFVLYMSTFLPGLSICHMHHADLSIYIHCRQRPHLYASIHPSPPCLLSIFYSDLMGRGAPPSLACWAYVGRVHLVVAHKYNTVVHNWLGFINNLVPGRCTVKTCYNLDWKI